MGVRGWVEVKVHLTSIQPDRGGVDIEVQINIFNTGDASIYIILFFPFSKKYKFKNRVRAFPKDATPPSSMDVVDGPSTSQSFTASGGGASGVEAPMKGFRVCIIGRLSKTKSELTQQIEGLGGRVVSSVSDNTTICISSDSKGEGRGCEC